MIEFEHLTNPEKYHSVPPRLEGENDEQYKARLKAYVQGVESQQAKIDELQARIDAALERCYTGIRKQGGDYYLELVEEILKGNKDEN